MISMIPLFSVISFGEMPRGQSATGTSVDARTVPSSEKKRSHRAHAGRPKLTIVT